MFSLKEIEKYTHGVNREIYIIDSVKLGVTGFMIDKNSNNYEKIIKEAKESNQDIVSIFIMF